MKKFVEVFMGSRGCLEGVELVESNLSLNDYYERKVDEIKNEAKIECEDEEDYDFITEFVGVDNYEGFSIVGLNEEECLYVFDFEVNKELCEKLLELNENEDFDSVEDIIHNLDY